MNCTIESSSSGATENQPNDAHVVRISTAEAPVPLNARPAQKSPIAMENLAAHGILKIEETDV